MSHKFNSNIGHNFLANRKKNWAKTDYWLIGRIFANQIEAEKIEDLPWFWLFYNLPQQTLHSV